MAYEVTQESMINNTNRDIREFRKRMSELKIEDFKNGVDTAFIELSRLEMLCSDIFNRINAYEMCHEYGAFPFEKLLTSRMISEQGLSQVEARIFGKKLLQIHVVEKLDELLKEIKPYRDEFYSHL